MRLNQGKIGIAEGCAVCALSLFVNGVFAVDSKSAYAGGNSTYLSIPLAILLALMLAAFVLGAAERAGEEGLGPLSERVFGRLGGILVSVPLALALVLSAAKPLSGFVEVLHRLVYDGVSYWSILVFIFPVIAFIAWKGFESIGRLALIFFGLIFVSAAVAVISASPEFSIDRLFPLPSAEGFFGNAVSGELSVLPPMAALLINAKGLGGTGTTRRILGVSALTAALLTCAVQLALALIYPYKVLSGLLMPLYRINFLSLSQSYMLRLDKLFIMVWLTGCVISSSYLVYSASLLVRGSFGARDVTPAVLTLSLVLCAVLAVGFDGKLQTAKNLLEYGRSYGFLLALIPLAAVGIGALFVKRKKKR